MTSRPSRTRRALAGGAAVSAAAAVLSLGAGSPAQAAAASTFRCYGLQMQGIVCDASVTGISSGSYLALHRHPNYADGVVPGAGHKSNGNVITLYCWTTGAGDADGHGDKYWFETVFGGAGGKYYSGYVNDWYVTTGSYQHWHSTGISHC